jgi:(2Fe-2S) ferredoxin
MPQPARHLFVCLNERSPGSRPACGERGGPAIFSALQRAIGHRPELWGQVAVTGCRCLGPCFEGPTVVVYPDAVWYAGVAAADAEEIVAAHLVGGQPVERLRYRWESEDENEET